MTISVEINLPEELYLQVQALIEKGGNVDAVWQAAMLQYLSLEGGK